MRTKVSYNPAGFSCAFAYHDHALLRSPGSARRLAHAESKLGPARFDAAKHWVLPQFHPAVGDEVSKAWPLLNNANPHGLALLQQAVTSWNSSRMSGAQLAGVRDCEPCS